MKIPLRRDIFHIETKPIAGALTIRQALCLIILAPAAVLWYALTQAIDIPILSSLLSWVLPLFSIPVFLYGWYRPRGGFKTPEEYLKPLASSIGISVARAVITLPVLEESFIQETALAKRIRTWGILVYEPSRLTEIEAERLLENDKKKRKPKKSPVEYECVRGDRHSRY